MNIEHSTSNTERPSADGGGEGVGDGSWRLEAGSWELGVGRWELGGGGSFAYIYI
jgi:hypothetical protein